MGKLEDARRGPGPAEQPAQAHAEPDVPRKEPDTTAIVVDAGQSAGPWAWSEPSPKVVKVLDEGWTPVEADGPAPLYTAPPLPDREPLDSLEDEPVTEDDAAQRAAAPEAAPTLDVLADELARVRRDAEDVLAQELSRVRAEAAQTLVAQASKTDADAGSQARVKTTQTIPRGIGALRRTLIDRGILRLEDGFLVFLSDVSFSSASSAAAAVIGTSANGRLVWKLPDGRSYGEWEVAQDEPGSSSRTSKEDVHV